MVIFIALAIAGFFFCSLVLRLAFMVSFRVWFAIFVILYLMSLQHWPTPS